MSSMVVALIVGLNVTAGSASAVRLVEGCEFEPECLAGCVSALQLVVSDDPIGPVQALGLASHTGNFGIFIDIDEDGLAPFEYSMTGGTADAECVGGPGGAIPTACDAANLLDELLKLVDGLVKGTMPPDEFVMRATQTMGPCIT